MISQQTLTLAFLFFCVVLAGPVIAQTETTSDQGTDTTDEQSRADERLTNIVLKTAQGIDNFFSNDRGVWQENKTRVTLRGNVDYIDDAGWDFVPEVKIYLALPGLNDRLRLIMNDEDEDGTGGARGSDDESNLAFRFVGSLTDRYGIAFDLGISTRGDPTLQGFVRANFFRQWPLGSWEGRLANRLYWYTDSHWRNDFRWYFEKSLSDKFFFRSRTRFDYQEDKASEVYPEQIFTLFQQINDRTALAYEAIARQIFVEDSPFFPDDFLTTCDKAPRCNQFQLRLRFRQNFKYPWLFYEIWPIAAFTEVRDYEFTPAIRFRLEVVLGQPPTLTRLDEG